jgi:hypothetical protein
MKSTIPKRVNYRILDDDANGLAIIEILEAPFDGVRYHFGEVGSFDTETEEVGVKFQFTIDEGDDTLEKDQKFQEVVAHVLYSIVTDNENRTNNTSTPSS